MDPETSSSTAEEDGFEVINGQLPHRPSSDASTSLTEEGKLQSVDVQLHPLPSKNAVLVSIQPPQIPEGNIRHVPCDIVLVIDVSGSMSTPAPLPTTDETGEKESTGLSVLDLTKHATRTIIETLNDRDRLGVVVFSTEAAVIHELSFMTELCKKDVLRKIEDLQPLSATNLWHGLKQGVDLIANASPLPQNTQAIYVLTDGQPNHMCPKQGYVPKLQQVLKSYRLQEKSVPSIHTFGFGYSIRSGLLACIAEVGGGTFAFIPDAGMIGTVFVHAVANLYTTLATHAELKLTGNKSFKVYLHEGSRIGIKEESSPDSDLTVPLGSLHYGQSRDIILTYKNRSPQPPVVQAALFYNHQGSRQSAASKERMLSDSTTLQRALIEYHCTRARICEFLRSLYSTRADKEYMPMSNKQLPKALTELEALIAPLQTSQYLDDQNASLRQELAGEDPQGQVRLALSDAEYYNRWGQHYLLSLLNAHTHQICNSFKDPGPLQYGKDSPLFQTCRAELENCFDNLPAPTPSLIVPAHRAGAGPITMSRYHRSSNPCFAGHCEVELKDSATIPVKDLRAGMTVGTPRGSTRVTAVIATSVKDIVLYKIGDLCITPWHPVRYSTIDEELSHWMFPREVPGAVAVPFSGTVYSVMLSRSDESDAHAITVGGQVCVTLGHGLVRPSHGEGEVGDARAHPFFGNYAKVVKSLNTLPRHENGLLLCAGLRYDAQTGLACGFVGRGRRILVALKARQVGAIRNRQPVTSRRSGVRHRGARRRLPA